MLKVIREKFLVFNRSAVWKRLPTTGVNFKGTQMVFDVQYLKSFRVFRCALG